MIGGELGVHNIKKIELKIFERNFEYGFDGEFSELHFITDEDVRLCLVFNKDIVELLRTALDNSKRM